MFQAPKYHRHLKSRKRHVKVYKFPLLGNITKSQSLALLKAIMEFLNHQHPKPSINDAAKYTEHQTPNFLHRPGITLSKPFWMETQGRHRPLVVTLSLEPPEYQVDRRLLNIKIFVDVCRYGPAGLGCGMNCLWGREIKDTLIMMFGLPCILIHKRPISPCVGFYGSPYRRYVTFSALTGCG